MKFSEQHALELMRTGQCLVRLHTRHRVLWLLANGEITGETAKKILERPDVEALGDGLFVGLSQTFSLVGCLMKRKSNKEQKSSPTMPVSCARGKSFTAKNARPCSPDRTVPY
jgi:hypothetical protein